MDFDDDGDLFDDGPGDDPFEDFFDENLETENSLDDDSEIEAEPTGDDICNDEFTVKDAVYLGGAMGFAFEEGQEEAERRKLEKKMEADRDRGNKRS